MGAGVSARGSGRARGRLGAHQGTHTGGFRSVCMVWMRARAAVSLYSRFPGAAALGLHRPPQGSQLRAPRRLPRAIPPRLRCVPRDLRGARRSALAVPGASLGEGDEHHRPRWTRHRRRGAAAHRPPGAASPRRTAGRGRPRFVAVWGMSHLLQYVALLRYGEDPPRRAVHPSHPRPCSCLPTQGQAPREKGLPLILGAFLLRVNFYTASRRGEIKLFVSSIFFPPPPAHLHFRGAQMKLPTRVGLRWDILRVAAKGQPGHVFLPRRRRTSGEPPGTGK